VLAVLNFDRCRLAPFSYQREDIQSVVNHPYYFLALDMGCGKTKVCIDAAFFLHEQGIIDKVLVIAPAMVRAVWFDETYGELQKHAWNDVPTTITEFSSRKQRQWKHGSAGEPLQWVISNYELLAMSKNRILQLLPFCTPKTLLILDESSFVKSHNAERTKACGQLRRACGRVVLLSGTPVSQSPLDLFSQANLMHASVLDCKYITYFKARYAIQSPVIGYGGKPIIAYGRRVQQITGWANLDDLQARLKPFIVRRMKKDVLADLPPKLDPVTLIATLTPETWKAYKSMRDDLVVWLTASTVSTAAQAVTKVMRLQQITSGFIGGVEGSHIDTTEHWDDLDTLPDDMVPEWVQVREIGKEKLDLILAWIAAQIEDDPNFRLVLWCRFRLELQRFVTELSKLPITVGAITGGQKPAEREAALRLLDPRTVPSGSVVVVGNPASGGMGISLVAANTVMYASNSHSVMQRLQSEDRTARPGQTLPCSYFDVCAEGPAGQKTIDFAVLKAIREKNDLAAWTASAWIHALQEE
jgi:hypothetical protein